MWKRIGQQDDPAWRRSGLVQRRAPVVAGRPGAPATAVAWEIPADLLDEEIRALLAAADALIAQHVPSASPEAMELLRAALAGVFRERLARLGAGSRDTQSYVEQMRRRLLRMSMDLGASESELAELRRQLQQFLAMGEWPAGSSLEGGLSPEAGDYQKKLALLTKIVEDNIALRSRPVSDLDA